ncbi:hypothetical protein OV079_41040 [Nannocystis pusilla]|uniref:Uncharacterized protein n=1 Tax=Nannocystis pusilla TaxID=889268 RepID=A0A9X3EWV4_9BACT|nr:hypothetical protein [Nannocystis pusilla]MCY1011837.1 hypothetical protein [Nannocystis pusilla]
MTARRKRSPSRSNSCTAARSRPNSCSTVTPASCSARYPLWTDWARRISSCSVRRRAEKWATITHSSGAAASDTSVRRQSITNIATRIDRITATSVRIVNTPNASVSLSASMSLVLRASRLPIGVLSKKRAGSRSTWPKIERRRSVMVAWPARDSA